MMWECTKCQVMNELDSDAEEGQFIICDECSAEFEVRQLDPLELEYRDTMVEVGSDPDGEDDAWDDD